VTLYLDPSALLKRYIDEPDSDRFGDILESDPTWLTCRITWVEVWRNLGRRLEPDMVATARSAFRTDWGHLALVEVDEVLCRDAGDIGAVTGARTLDAMHLAALQRAGPQGVTLVTADLRQAQAGRSLGFEVVGS
jgi:uncharacterized protein